MDSRAVNDLARSGITPEQAASAGLFFAPDASRVDASLAPLPAVILPYYTTACEPMLLASGEHFIRARYVELPPGNGFVKSKFGKYGQPKASGVRAYFPPIVDWLAIQNDPRTPVVIVEGEKKALAGTLSGFAVIGLGGVHNWTKDGELIPELDAFKWHNRVVYLAFDSDAADNPRIQYAEIKLVDELMRQRGARVHLVRFPHKPDGSKCGLDDYLVEHGPEALEKLLREAEPLGAMDAAVLALNRHVAFIEREGQVYDLAGKFFWKDTAFTKGGRYSSWTVRRVVTTGAKPGVKEEKVAQIWLTHPLARRYAELLFRPSEGEITANEAGAPCLNLWHGWNAEAGDVTPFLRLHDYVFSQLPVELQDFPLKLMAYKAQHPKEKTFALVMTGNQGSGKSLWSGAIADAFNPYAWALDSQQFLSEFQGWIEKGLMVVVNEAKPEHLEEAAEILKAFITDVDHMMNEKFRVKRMVKCYSSFILTANNRGVGAFSHDDRRMFVVPCPSPHPDGNAFYGPIGEWKRNGGGRALMHYLLNYDLKGWRPPPRPPATAEKAMARRESLSEIEQLAEDIRTANYHTIIQWLSSALSWALSMRGNANPNLARYGKEIEDAYNTMQVRDWYTASEIAGMFPQIAATLYGSRKVQATIAGNISRQLRNAGVRYLVSKDSEEGFYWRGKYQQFLIIANVDDWIAPMSQSDFERAMRTFPRYADIAKQGAKDG